MEGGNTTRRTVVNKRTIEGLNPASPHEYSCQAEQRLKPRKMTSGSHEYSCAGEKRFSSFHFSFILAVWEHDARRGVLEIMTIESRTITDNLDDLLAVLPPDLARAIAPSERPDLIEIVLDLGRRPEARFTNRAAYLREEVVSREELKFVEERVGAFGDDNRAGIPATLHRISAMRNRRGEVVGMTLRIGRAVMGIVDILRDLIESGQSLLLMGRPGLGKTTLLREMARVLADELGKRVVIVDTSNEIAGDGDVPHPAIGRARRMQVARVAQQHDVMIEAVENHMPEVVVIDEIGRVEETLAARTIAERGVQLVATVHGNTLDNLLANPTMSDLIGGIQAVTLSDEEARRRGTQKTVLERKAPPTFDVVIEMIERDQIAIRRPVGEIVDALLRGSDAPPEMRRRNENGDVIIEQPAPIAASNRHDRDFELRGYSGGQSGNSGGNGNRGASARGNNGRNGGARNSGARHSGTGGARGNGQRGARSGDDRRGAGAHPRGAIGGESLDRREAGRRAREEAASSDEFFELGARFSPPMSTHGGGAEANEAFAAAPGAAFERAVRNAEEADRARAIPEGYEPKVSQSDDSANSADEIALHPADKAQTDATQDDAMVGERVVFEDDDEDDDDFDDEESAGEPDAPGPRLRPDTPVDVSRVRRLYPFGVSRSRLGRAVKHLGLPISVARTWREADAVMMLTGPDGVALDSSLLRAPREMGLPIIAVQSNTYAHVLARLTDLYAAQLGDGQTSPRDMAIREAQNAVQRVLQEAEPVELRPQGKMLRRVQHQMAERFHLRSYSVGREPNRRVRYLPSLGRQNAPG
jgi:stage III sporulation protein SpoIIIAA